MIKKLALSVFYLIVCASTAYAQSVAIQSINAGGGAASLLTNSLYGEWSIGQVFANNYIADDAIISEGFQQYYPESIMSGERLDSSILVGVFPNPFSDLITIKSTLTDESKDLEMHLRIYDTSGQMVVERTFKSRETQLEASFLREGIYIMLIEKEGKYLKAEKIIKKQ